MNWRQKSLLVGLVVGAAVGFGKVLVEVQSSGNSAGYLGDLKGVGKPRPVMVSQRGDKYLCLVFEAAKSL